ncbi:hypothetical protein L3Q67_07820 [Saccharothrix sp. AJ9571]|nr:hypothetical protein L3Q67_07820 [Saccharothrix sp. AJ9571]
MRIDDAITLVCGSCGEPHVQVRLLSWTPCLACDGSGIRLLPVGSEVVRRVCGCCSGEARIGLYSDAAVSTQERDCARMLTAVAA